MDNKARSNTFGLTQQAIEMAEPNGPVSYTTGDFVVAAQPANIKFVGQALAQFDHGDWSLPASGHGVFMLQRQDSVLCVSGNNAEELNMDRWVWSAERHCNAAAGIYAWYSTEAYNRFIVYDDAQLVNKWETLAHLLAGDTVHLKLYPWQDEAQVDRYMGRQYREELRYWCGFVG